MYAEIIGDMFKGMLLLGVLIGIVGFTIAMTIMKLTGVLLLSWWWIGSIIPGTLLGFWIGSTIVRWIRNA